MAIRKIVRSFVSLSILTSVLSLWAVTVSSTSSAATIPACSVNSMTGVAAVGSRSGGVPITVLLTSHQYPTCTWSSQTGVQFLTPRGIRVGPVVRSTSVISTANRTLLDTFQIALHVATMSGVRCTTALVNAVRVVAPNGKALRVLLNRTFGVCVGGTTKWTTIESTTLPTTTRCQSSSLQVSIGPAQGTAGTTYLPLLFRNRGTVPCVVSGVPTVQPEVVTSSKTRHPLGAKARLIDLSASGSGQAIRLVPGGIASAPFGVVETGNYTSSQCVARTVSGIEISLMSGSNWWIPAQFSVCTRLASTTISGLVPSIDGAPPLS